MAARDGAVPGGAAAQVPAAQVSRWGVNGKGHRPGSAAARGFELKVHGAETVAPGVVGSWNVRERGGEKEKGLGVFAKWAGPLPPSSYGFMILAHEHW